MWLGFLCVILDMRSTAPQSVRHFSFSLSTFSSAIRLINSYTTHAVGWSLLLAVKKFRTGQLTLWSADLKRSPSSFLAFAHGGKVVGSSRKCFDDLSLKCADSRNVTKCRQNGAFRTTYTRFPYKMLFCARSLRWDCGCVGESLYVISDENTCLVDSHSSRASQTNERVFASGLLSWVSRSGTEKVLSPWRSFLHNLSGDKMTFNTFADRRSMSSRAICD